MTELKAILFETGDFILCKLESEDIDFRKKLLTVRDPIKISLQEFVRDGVIQEALVLKTWFPFSENETQVVQTSKIVSYTDVTNVMWINQYYMFLEHRAEKRKVAEAQLDAHKLGFDYDNEFDEAPPEEYSSMEDFLKQIGLKYGTKPRKDN